jgi:hypothetical protein
LEPTAIIEVRKIAQSRYRKTGLPTNSAQPHNPEKNDFVVPRFLIYTVGIVTFLPKDRNQDQKVPWALDKFPQNSFFPNVYRTS